MKKKLITLTCIALCTSNIMHGAQQSMPTESTFPTLRELCLREVASTVTMDLDQFKSQVATSSSKNNIPHITEQLMKQEGILQEANDRLPQLIQGDIVLELRKKHKQPKPLLSWAITKDKNDIVQLILSSRIYESSDNYKYILQPIHEIINEQDDKGCTPLIVAIDYEKNEIARDLINLDANLELQNRYKETALMVAIEKSNNEIAELLIEKNVIHHTQDNWQGPALYCAIRKNSLNIVQKLLEAGADPNYIHKGWLETPLMLAIKKENLSMIDLLLKNSADLKKENEECQTALMFAAANCNNPEIILALINAGADPNQKNRRKETALMVAAKALNLEAVKLLIEKGAALDDENVFVEAALDFAALRRNGHKIIQELVNAGANKDKQDQRHDYTPLMTAAFHGNLQTVNALIELNANLELQNNNGETALMLAAEEGYETTTQALINAGANLNIQNRNIKTALMLAAKNGCITTTQALINAGANLDIQDQYGETALMIATKENKTKIVQALITAGADIEIKSRSNDTALTIARRHANYSYDINNLSILTILQNEQNNRNAQLPFWRRYPCVTGSIATATIVVGIAPAIYWFRKK